jgi:hypothetical protein
MADIKEKGHRTAGYVAAIIVNIILIFVFNNLQHWVSFLTRSYSGVLWAIDLSLGVTILANILFLFYDAGWFRHLLRMVLNVIAIFATFIIYSVFPFTFAGEVWAFWVKVGLIVVMVCIAIATIVEFFRLIFVRD